MAIYKRSTSNNGEQCTLGSFSFGGGPRYSPSLILPIREIRPHHKTFKTKRIGTRNLSYPGTKIEDLKDPFPISGPSG